MADGRSEQYQPRAAGLRSTQRPKFCKHVRFLEKLKNGIVMTVEINWYNLCSLEGYSGFLKNVYFYTEGYVATFVDNTFDCNKFILDTFPVGLLTIMSFENF